MGKGLTQPSKNTASPQEEANGLNTASKARMARKQLDPPEEAKAQHI